MTIGRIPAGMYAANTVEIARELAYVDTFNEKIIKDAGFKLISVKLRGSRQVDKTPETIKVNGFSYSITHETSMVWHIPEITKDIVKTMRAIQAKDPLAAITVIGFTLRKGNNTYEFQVCGGKKKEAILRRRNGVLNYDCKMKDLLIELEDLLNRQCYFGQNLNTVNVLCDPKKVVNL